MQRAPYERMADTIRRAIDDGDFAPGTTLPPTMTLAEPHGIRSQDTALKALRLLEQEGYLTVQPRKRAVVRQRPKIRAVVRDRHAYRDEIGYYFDQNAKNWRATSTPTRGLAVPPRHIAELLGVPEGEDVIVRDRAMGPPDTGEALQLATSYIPVPIAAEIPTLRSEDPGAGGIYDRIEEHYGQPIEWQETVLSRLPSAEEQERLGVRPTTPLLVVTRESVIRAPGGPVTVEVNETRMLAERFAVSYEVIRDETARWPREGRN